MRQIVSFWSDGQPFGFYLNIYLNKFCLLCPGQRAWTIWGRWSVNFESEFMNLPKFRFRWERERWILWHVPAPLNVWRWKMWPPLSIADSSRHNTCVCGLVISSRARTACHRHYPPPPTLSSPQETILTMCVACAKCARFLFPEIGPILNTTPNLRTKQTDIRFWIIPRLVNCEIQKKYTKNTQVNKWMA